MIKEFCAENFTDIEQAIAAGAKRIELCDNLAVGGTTPSYGVLKTAIQVAHQHGVEVMTMIRPRGGDFVYTDLEHEMMLADIEMARALGTDGVVLGALTPDDKLDKIRLLELLSVAAGLKVTFHMAFDALDPMEQFDAIIWLADHGVTGILTHGGAAEDPITANLDRLSKLVTFAQGRLELIIGGGVTAENCDSLAQALGVNQVHGTKIVFDK